MYDCDNIKSSIADSADPIFKDLVQRDLKQSIDGSELAIDQSQYPLLLVQTTEGHAKEGHGIFGEEGYYYPDVTTTDIISAAGLNVKETKEFRQKLIDDVFEWIELAKQDRVDRLVYKKQPLLGIHFLRHFSIDPEYALKGMILAAFMDNFDWRTETLKKYENKTIHEDVLTLGGGETCLIDKNKLIEWDPHYLHRLANEEITFDETDYLRALGIIVDTPNSATEVAYVRRRKGNGTSDDMAFIMMAKMFEEAGWEKARSALLGGFIVDGIDTYDKCVSKPTIGGYDELIGWNLRDELPDLVSDDDISQLIYYSAKSNGGKLVSSSHKRLIQFVGDKNRKPTLLHHMKFAENGKYEHFKVGFDQMSSRGFYGNVRQRLNHYEKHR